MGEPQEVETELTLAGYTPSIRREVGDGKPRVSVLGSRVVVGGWWFSTAGAGAVLEVKEQSGLGEASSGEPTRRM